MPFENFYEESDKTKHNRWKILGLVILVIFGWLCLILFIATRPPKSPEEIEKTITQSAILTRVDRICNEIPKPEKFQFVYKQLGGNSLKVSISHRFKTDRQNKEIEVFFRLFLTSNDWIEDEYKSLRFKKGKQSVAIERVAFPNADWTIDCGEEY